MNYESLSTVVVLVILVLVVAVWLPNKTDASMRHVEEHREDRLSPSLRLIDVGSGTRFSDARTPRTKGIAMQPEHTVGELTDQRIARVRAMRKAAVARRQIVVAVLAVITIVVLGLAIGLRFSPFFALIPAALLGVVLALGVRAAGQARRWEQRVAKVKAERRAEESRRAQAASKANVKPQFTALSVDDAPEVKTGAAQDESPTEPMEQREIRRVLHDAAVAKSRREQPDATTQLAQVTAAPALEAGDVAAAQDLISFSLGAEPVAAEPEPQAEVEAVAEPVSLEIKSTRQVAKAEPVDEDTRARLTREAHESVMADAVAFHEAESRAEVEPPAATSDSLSVGLEAIFARRVS